MTVRLSEADLSSRPARSSPAAPVVVRQASADEIDRWDELIARFPAARIVHTLGWVRSLEACRLGRPVFLVFERAGEVVGCLPGLLTRVGPLRVFGSPLPGWQTSGMGPLFDPEAVSSLELLGPLVPFLRGQYGVHHVELATGVLESAAMRALGFRGEVATTYKGALTPDDEPRTLTAFKDSARRNVKRARKLGLIVRFEDEPDERFIDEHYSQIREVFERGGHAVPFSHERVAAYVRHMRDSGHLIAVSVYLPDGTTCIATGTFTAYGGELLLWMWTHRTEHRWYRATELMTWSVMQRAMARGCTVVDFMGRGDFKAKLGAAPDHSQTRWVWTRFRALLTARRLAARAYRFQQRVRGTVSRWLRSRARVRKEADPRG